MRPRHRWGGGVGAFGVPSIVAFTALVITAFYFGLLRLVVCLFRSFCLPVRLPSIFSSCAVRSLFRPLWFFLGVYVISREFIARIGDGCIGSYYTLFPI